MKKNRPQSDAYQLSQRELIKIIGGNKGTAENVINGLGDGSVDGASDGTADGYDSGY
ncbi:hypothetical protein [uncultured Dokdonia sp.]|uniref:hypothetical protein n=1 Tax=uncultured Dokdonia sp. TaxID=575653 RepID=UPI00263603E0|nr:hypothetical protein [uncultured Dokdonia sp.]